jgi:uncharacterized protein involved in outer membrane biogenesis
MRRFLKILAGVAAVLIVVVVGGVAYLLNIDLNDWKPEIQEAARDATGRELTIEGPIEFELGTDTRLKATGIALSNAEWGSRPQMVEIGLVEVELKLFSLLGTPDITRIRVEDVNAIVETNAEGTSNTEFPSEQEAASEPDHGGGGELVLPIIRDLRIANVNVVMQDAQAGTEQAFTLTELSLQGQDETSPMELTLDAAYDDLALIMAGSMGSVASMTDSGTPTPVDFTGNLAGIDVAIQGAIADLAGQRGIDITVSAMGEELAEAARTFAGQDIPALGGFKVDATLAGDGDSLSVDPLSVDIGKPDVIRAQVNGTIANLAGQDGFDLAVSVNSEEIGNLSPLANAFAGQDVPALGPLSVALSVQGGMEDGLAANGIDVSLGRAETLLLTVTGSVADLMRQDGIDLAIAGNSPELGNLSDIAERYSGQPLPDIGPMSLAAQVGGGMQDGLALSGLNLDFGREETLKASVTGGVGNLMQQTDVDITVAATSPEIGNVSPLVEAATQGGASVPALGPLDLSLKVAGDAQETLSLSDLALALGKAETVLIEANGEVNDLVRLSGANLGFTVVSPDLAAAGNGLPAIGPVDISGTVSGDQGEPITLDPFSAKIGGSDISGTASFDGTGDVPRITARLSSERFDLNDVTGGGGAGSGSGGAASGGGQASGGGDGRVIPGDPLPLDALRSINADIGYTAQTLVATAELTNFEIAITLEGGKLDISPLKGGVGEGSLDGMISLDGSQDAPPVRIDITGTQMGLGSLVAGAGLRDRVEGPIDLRVDLTGAGASPRAIAASLNGSLQASLYDSRILKQAFVDAMGETLANMLASEGGWIVIDCTVFDYDVKNGLMETLVGYTASGPVTVATRGTIDLSSEQLDLKAKPAGGGGFASVPLVITGSFANPSVIPDPVAIGTGILAGVLTGGLAPALLAVVGDLPDDHPCKQEVAESQQQLENQEESGSTGNPVEDAGRAIQEGVGGAIQGIFGGGD